MASHLLPRCAKPGSATIALLDWIATQPDLDPERVAVEGASYGGYMSLAVATHYADRIAGSIDVIGIANFVTFLERTEATGATCAASNTAMSGSRRCANS